MIDKLKHLLAGTLRRRLTSGMATVVAVTMALFVFDMTRREEAFVIGQQSAQAAALAQSVAKSSAVWLASRDFAGLQEIVDGLSGYPDLRHAIVLDRQGQVQAHSDKSRLGLYLDDLPTEAKPTVLQRTSRFVDVASPVMLGANLIGWVRIGLAGDALDADLAIVRRNGLLYGLVALALSVIFAMLTGRYLTQRLDAIQRVADAVQAGDSGLRAKLPGDDEAARLARQFNRMLESLERQRDAIEKANAELTQFANISAHHLMEPSRRLLLFAQRLRVGLVDKIEDEDARASLGFIEQGATRMRDLVRDIERYLAASAPRGPLQQNDPAVALAEVQKRLAGAIAASGARIEIPALSPVCLDLPRLVDLFEVLIGNALIHANPAVAPLVRIGGEQQDAVTRLRIEDNGPGIPAEYRQRVFGVFERLAANPRAGTGIGLAIARRIVDSRGGRIWIETSPLGGAAIVCELPNET